MPDFFCFNTHQRKHAEWYGVAFYDVNTSGRQKEMADRLKPGDDCLVATDSDDGQTIEFGWFTYLHDKILIDPQDKTKVRVLFGKLNKSEQHPRAYALVNAPFSKFFKQDGSGSFKTGLCVMKA